eukprot:5557827-Pleurochrysis_carterae.AAC.2
MRCRRRYERGMMAVSRVAVVCVVDNRLLGAWAMKLMERFTMPPVSCCTRGALWGGGRVQNVLPAQ